MTQLNRELLEETMQHILDHPEQHNQAVWAERTECGTAACFAGWAVSLAGHQWDFCRETIGGTNFAHTTGGGSMWISELAMDLLGLDSTDATRLFDWANSVDDLQHIVKDLLNKGDNK